MLKWFRSGPSPYQTALAMVGVKSGNQVVVVGATDLDLAAQLAVVTGLNGQTLVVERADERARVEDAAGRAGALVEFAEGLPTALPVDTGSVDVLVMVVGLASLSADERRHAVDEVMRVLRPGGRMIVIEGPKATARGGHSRSGTDANLSADAILALLAGVGGKAVRRLAAVGAVTYYEAIKARVPDVT